MIAETKLFLVINLNAIKVKIKHYNDKWTSRAGLVKLLSEI